MQKLIPAKISSLKVSLREQFEAQIIKSKVHYDPTSEQFKVWYPFTQDPSILPNNKVQVIEIAEKEEKAA